MVLYFSISSKEGKLPQEPWSLVRRASMPVMGKIRDVFGSASSAAAATAGRSLGDAFLLLPLSLCFAHSQPCSKRHGKTEHCKNGTPFFVLRSRRNRFQLFLTETAMTTGTAMAADTAVTVEREGECGGSRLSLIDCLASCTSETPSAASSQAGKVCLTKGHLHLRHRETIPPASSLASHTRSLARTLTQSVSHSFNQYCRSEREA